MGTSLWVQLVDGSQQRVRVSPHLFSGHLNVVPTQHHALSERVLDIHLRRGRHRAGEPTHHSARQSTDQRLAKFDTSGIFLVGSRIANARTNRGTDSRSLDNRVLEDTKQGLSDPTRLT
jgi:hypothetical protein